MKTNCEVSYLHFILKPCFYEWVFDWKPFYCLMPVTGMVSESDSPVFFDWQLSSYHPSTYCSKEQQEPEKSTEYSARKSQRRHPAL